MNKYQKVLNAIASGRGTAQQMHHITNNPAQYILELRRKGWELPTSRIQYITQEGKSSWYGLYQMTEKDRARLRVSL
ncbi:MAG: hypothetical protein KDI44_06145 [Thiothrix sp.]|nr:hypothetical protein [Thiothrix sp.]HPQ96921.1 helix-turn-helix domain-containing protein [Thiolinea sp.]